MDINKLELSDIQPSQFYISAKKVYAIQSWFNKDDLSNFTPVTVKELDGRIIFTDGHTRAWVAYSAGLQKIPLAWENDDLDWKFYQMCVDACIEHGVYRIADLKGRILSGFDYMEKWDDWCKQSLV